MLFFHQFLLCCPRGTFQPWNLSLSLCVCIITSCSSLFQKNGLGISIIDICIKFQITNTISNLLIKIQLISKFKFSLFLFVPCRNKQTSWITISDGHVCPCTSKTKDLAEYSQRLVSLNPGEKHCEAALEQDTEPQNSSSGATHQPDRLWLNWDPSAPGMHVKQDGF